LFAKKKNILTASSTMTFTTRIWTRTFYLMNAFGITLKRIFLFAVARALLIGEGRTLRAFRTAGKNNVLSNDSSFSPCNVNGFPTFEVPAMQNNIIMMTTKFFLRRAM
jgi:hypothetical protein